MARLRPSTSSWISPELARGISLTRGERSGLSHAPLTVEERRGKSHISLRWQAVGHPDWMCEFTPQIS
jgi:hypothetical protein